MPVGEAVLREVLVFVKFGVMVIVILALVFCVVKLTQRGGGKNGS